ncbi:hypothetical protein GCM10009769_30370 [Curtobacterium luteum]|uniref:Uncharacterized protein n=1 Tax=Curtobacterium luteum TaxID=33881 RepID=A0A8H9GAR6_9MICO|nr:hypothetical protein GCM10009769_30370 [Curtobacterium luteum]
MSADTHHAAWSSSYAPDAPYSTVVIAIPTASTAASSTSCRHSRRPTGKRDHAVSGGRDHAVSGGRDHEPVIAPMPPRYRTAGTGRD